MIGDKLGASQSVIQDDPWDWPLHGLRHPPEAGTNGWYLWTGELRQEPGFFLPWHLGHVVDRCPDLLGLLQSPPGITEHVHRLDPQPSMQAWWEAMQGVPILERLRETLPEQDFQTFRTEVIALRARFADVTANGTVKPFNRYVICRVDPDPADNRASEIRPTSEKNVVQ